MVEIKDLLRGVPKVFVDGRVLRVHGTDDLLAIGVHGINISLRLLFLSNWRKLLLVATLDRPQATNLTPSSQMQASIANLFAGLRRSYDPVL